MSLRTKRPSSARRNIKQETFSSFVSGTRLRHVQSLLNDGSAQKKNAPDSILCIAGIDSRYNDGMTELINYLLFGFFELRKQELEGSGFDEEVIDDVLLCIQTDRVDVYCNPINYHYLLPYVSHWRNVFFHCLTDTEYEDEEVAEDFKITTFVSLVKDHPKIGIPYSNSNHQQKFDPMLIEKWPIIQVYGVEGVGGGGFFTMQHEVVDVSSDVHKLYSLMDPVALETLIVEQVTRLEKQWQTMLSTVDVNVNGSTDSILLTEDKVFEPLRSFYIHGQANGIGDGQQGNSDVPCVLFGGNTCRTSLERASTQMLAPTGDFNSTVVGKSSTNFMVCKAVSPRGPVTCSRTYFLLQNFINPFQEGKITKYEDNADLRLLTVVYGAMVDAVLTGIQAYSSTLSLEQAEQVALETIHETCSRVKDDTVAQFLKSRPDIHFSIHALDCNGSRVSVLTGQRSLLMKSAAITIYDIPCVTKPGTVLGSLMFGESFLDSEIRVQQTDGSSRLDGSFLLLTDHIPRHMSWACKDLCADRKLLQATLEGGTLGESFGSLLISGDPVNLGCSNTVCLPVEEASLFAYEHGMVVMCPQYGAIVLHANHIRSARFYDGDSSNTVAVLVLEYQSTFVPFIPFHLQNEDCQLILLFTPKSKAYKHLYSEVLHTWREESDSPKVKRVEELPDNCQLLHTLVQHRYMSTAGKKVKTVLQKASTGFPHLYRFLDHFSASSVGWNPIPENDLSKVLRRSNMAANGIPADEEKDVEIVVTILSGLPGSHQQQMCDVLSNLSKDQNRYVVLKPQLDGSQQFSPLDVQAKLKATLNVHRRRRQSQLAMRNTRVIYVVPGYTDIVNVVQAIECHPDVDVRSHCAIGSITACVDPLNVFMEHKFTVPYLLNLCADGWVNQIVMTSSTALMNDDLEEIQHMLRSVNSEVSFLLAEQGNVSRSMDLDAILSEESFHEVGKVRARYLSVPGWRESPRKPRKALLATTQLRFTLPLDKQKLLLKLRGLKKNLASYPFTGNIYNVQGKIKFLDSKTSEYMEVRYTTLNNNLIISPYTESAREKTQSAGSVMVFTGCNLAQTQLKDWLRDCAPPKPEKKPLISREDLKRDAINKIHKDHHLDQLPEGWFYNGTQYVDFDGTKQDQHPGLDEFVERYIEEKNAAILEHNRQVDLLLPSFQDLFS